MRDPCSPFVTHANRSWLIFPHSWHTFMTRSLKHSHFFSAKVKWSLTSHLQQASSNSQPAHHQQLVFPNWSKVLTIESRLPPWFPRHSKNSPFPNHSHIMHHSSAARSTQLYLSDLWKWCAEHCGTRFTYAVILPWGGGWGDSNWILWRGICRFRLGGATRGLGLGGLQWIRIRLFPFLSGFMIVLPGTWEEVKLRKRKKKKGKKKEWGSCCYVAAMVLFIGNHNGKAQLRLLLHPRYLH